MQLALQILEEYNLSMAIKKFERNKIENEGAQVLLERANELYQSQREMICQWIIDNNQIALEYKFQAYNILGCTLNEQQNQMLNFKNALRLGLKHQYDISDPLINLQKVYLDQQQYEGAIKCAKYLDLFQGRHKVVALLNLAKAYFGLNQINECQEYSKMAYQQCRSLYGIKDPMTKRLGEYLNLLSISQGLNQNQQTLNQQNQTRLSLQSRQMSLDLSKTFTKLNFQNITNNLKIENSNAQEIRVEFCSNNKKTHTQDNQNLCCELITKFFRLADITLIIKNVEQNTICQKLSQKYQDLLHQLNYGDEESFDQISQISLISDEGSNNNLYIYQFQPQNENNISELDKMIYLQSEFFEGFFSESDQKNINFTLDDKLFQYKIVKESQSNQDEISDFFYNIKNTLDQVVILTFNCVSETEAFRIKNILKQKRIYKNITDQLNVEYLDIILSSDINLNDFTLYPDLEQQAQNLRLQTNLIILICMLVQPADIKKMQEQLQALVSESQNLQLVKEQFEIELTFNPDANVTSQKIKNLQQKEEQFEISVSQPQHRVGYKKPFVVYSTIEFWMDSKNQQMDVVQQTLERIKDSIFSIYFQCQDIFLNDEKQIKLWQKFLYQFYPNNSKESYTIDTQLKIELKGELTVIEEKSKIIESDLKEFQCKRFNFEIQDKIAQALAEKQNFQKLFKSSLEKIQQQYGQCLIQIVEVSDDKISVDVYINDQSKLINMQNYLQSEFFQKLSIHVEKNFEIEDLYTYRGMQKQEFKDEYQLEVSKINKEYYFICQNQNMDEIKKLIVKTKQYKKENRKTQIIECQNILVWNELKEQNMQYSYSKEILYNYSKNQRIIIQATNHELLTEKCNTIQSDIRKLESQLECKTCLFQEKQVKFFKKNHKEYYKNLKNEWKATIKFKSNIYSLISQVLYQNKKLQLVQADITLLDCDAIVNIHCSKKQKGLSKLTKTILDFGGSQYRQQFNDHTNSAQNQCDITIHELIPFRNIRFIINLVIPFQQIIDINDPQPIEQIIDDLFNKIRNQYEIFRLAIPIFNICENTQYIQTYLNALIKKLFNFEHSIREIYIAETNNERIKTVESMLSEISKDYANSYQKYQWQWKDVITYVNYDEDINKQIDDAYKQFLKSNQETTIKLKYQLEKKPSTHYVDLQYLKIIELSSQSEQQIIFTKLNNKITYSINNEELEEELTQYFINMYNKQCLQFQIFWKELVVVINNQGNYQLNTRTKYQRNIQKIPYEQDKMESKQRITFEQNINMTEVCENQIIIQSFEAKLNNIILAEIQQYLLQSSITIKVDIPSISNTYLQHFIRKLETVAQRITGIVISGQSINIQIFKNKEKKFLDSIKNPAKIEYPQEWTAQNENCIKVLLGENSTEFNQIKSIFQETDRGVIKAIFRIQNKALYDNYILESQKLLNVCLKKKKLLLPLEQKRYLWHGVSSQHPSVIYKSLDEAFDVTYSRVGLWGQGIYFAENAAYSRNYSYQIKLQDDPQYAGNFVFLCCLVTTGRAEERQECRDIKKPSDGYDCVTGFTKGSKTFVIYQMHVRRAYPAYEVIFQ